MPSLSSSLSLLFSLNLPLCYLSRLSQQLALVIRESTMRETNAALESERDSKEEAKETFSILKARRSFTFLSIDSTPLDFCFALLAFSLYFLSLSTATGREQGSFLCCAPARERENDKEREKEGEEKRMLFVLFSFSLDPPSSSSLLSLPSQTFLLPQLLRSLLLHSI